MAEKLIARQTGNQIPLELRKKYSEVRQYETNGRIVIYGIDKANKRRKQIGYRKLVSSFGKDPDAKFRPKPVPGIWGGSGGERAVNVIGVHGIDKSGRPLMRIQGNNQKVPRGEIKWSDSKKESRDEVEQLRSEVDELNSRLQKMEKEFRKLVNQKNELEVEKEILSARNAELEGQLRTYRGRLDGYEGMPIVPDRRSTRSESRAGRGWNRAAGWVGSHLPRGRRPEYENTYIEEREGEPVLVAQEEAVDGFTYYERRRGAGIILGAAAAVGAAVLIAWAWGEHEEHEGPNRAPAVSLPAPTHPQNDPTAGMGSRHEVLLHGNKAFKVSLPGNLEWETNADGSQRIDDINGHVVVPHVYWDRQGNLDKDSRKLLRTDSEHNFVLEQKSYPYHTPGTSYGSHYETEVLNG